MLAVFWAHDATVAPAVHHFKRRLVITRALTK